MTTLGLESLLGISSSVALLVVGIFGFGKKPDENTVLDSRTVYSQIKIGIDDLVDSDVRGLGYNRVSKDISLEELELAGRIRDALHGEDDED